MLVVQGGPGVSAGCGGSGPEAEEISVVSLYALRTWFVGKIGAISGNMPGSKCLVHKVVYFAS